MNDLSQTPPFVLPDSNYVPPAGVMYDEIRAIDPSAPPVVIDIAGNLNNKKVFNLSDIATSVRYLMLRPPPDVNWSILTRYSIVSDDDHIFINTLQGLFCYSAEGQYLYTVVRNQHETEGNTTTFVDGTNIFSNIDLLNGKLVAKIMEPNGDMQLSLFDVSEMNAQMLFSFQSNELRNNRVKPQYQRKLGFYGERNNRILLYEQFLFMEDHSILNKESLSITALSGDTLCNFNDYNKSTVDRVVQSQGHGVGVASNIYRIHGQTMLQMGHNDTVFRISPPNLLTPAYVMNWGQYKPDIIEHTLGSALEGKLVLDNWVETSRFIFIYYTEGRDYPRRREQGNVRDRWAIYDKSAKTLTHLSTSEARYNPIRWENYHHARHGRTMSGVTDTFKSDRLALIENDVDPVGMPFWPQGVNHRGEMYMVFSKETIKRYIERGINRNDRLQAIFDSLNDEEVVIMLVN